MLAIFRLSTLVQAVPVPEGSLHVTPSLKPSPRGRDFSRPSASETVSRCAPHPLSTSEGTFPFLSAPPAVLQHVAGSDIAPKRSLRKASGIPLEGMVTGERYLQAFGGQLIPDSSMKRLLIIFSLGCLWFFVSCGPKGPRIVQKEGFVLIYDTLDLDLRQIMLPGYRLEFEQAVKEGDGYLCLLTQQNVYDSFSPSYRINLLLKIDPKTRTFHKVDLPYPNIIVEDKLTVAKDTVYLLDKEFSRQFRFNPENETWEEVSSYADVVYEDDDWRVVTRDIRYAGSHTWFIDRKTGKEYFFLTKPGQILRYNGYYYLTDPERFRGIADPREGFLCDSTSTYEAIMEDCPDCTIALPGVVRRVSNQRQTFMLSARVMNGVGANHGTASRTPCSMRPSPQKDLCTKWLQRLFPPMSLR